MPKKCKVLITFSIMFLIIVLLTSNYIVNADMGAKPSITIKLENMNTTDYLIDLLVYDEKGDAYSSPMNCNDSNTPGPTEKQVKTLYDINYDGWISESTRWNYYLLFADVVGNAKHEHLFSYFGTPETYKVVIVYNNGETKVTDIIHRTDFSSNITIDANTMNVDTKANSTKSSSSIKNITIALITTFVVEIIIALIMKIKNIKTIFITNLVTNIILQLSLLYIPLSYIIKFAIIEILIIITEYFVYKRYFNNISENKVIGYTLLANLTSALLTFIIK